MWVLSRGEKDVILWQLTPEEFKNAPDGTVLWDITGLRHIKGKNYIDQDTRYGYIAFGVLDNPAALGASTSRDNRHQGNHEIQDE
jgi:hypothetical protein